MGCQDSRKSQFRLVTRIHISGLPHNTEATGNILTAESCLVLTKVARYHGHARGQIQDGLYGAIIIR